MTIDVDNWWNQNSSTTGSSDGPVGSLINRVYLGESGPKQIKMKRGGQTINVPAGDKTIGIAEAKRMYLTDDKLRNQWNVLLRKNGLDADPLQARAIWDLAVDGASDWYATSQGQQKVTPQQYLTWYATGKTGGKQEQVPTRQIYNVLPEQIAADINDIAVQKLGREITDADQSADWYKDLVKSVQKMYKAGVVSEPGKLVKNKKTGKMERLVQQSPEFSKEGVTAAITEAVEAADPESLARKERLDFTKWLYSQKGTQG